MDAKLRNALLILMLIPLNCLTAAAQLRPQVTPKPKKTAPARKPEKPPEPKPAQILVQTSPGAQVYLDDALKGQASPQGRLVIENPQPGDHRLRVTLAGKKDYEQQVSVVAGQTAEVKAQLADIEQPSPGAQVETPRRGVSTRVAGAVRVNPKDGLKYVWIPPGTFRMGCSPGDSECGDNEKPAHQVTISKGFWIGHTEVTVDAYKRFASETGRGMPSAPSFNNGWSNGQIPIVYVSWNDAQAYCAWSGGRLPTEAEWEYAARGGSTEARYGPLDEVAWYDANSSGGTHSVGEKRANAFGLFDTLGNVWEWVNDWYNAAYYANSPSSDPSGPSSGNSRVLRGGSWGGNARDVGVSFRHWKVPGFRGNDKGSRCAREVAP